VGRGSAPGVVGLPGSFLDQAAFSVIALTDLTVEVCSHDAFIAACYRQPKFALVLSWLAVHEATSYAEHIVDIGRRTLIERLGHFLLQRRVEFKDIKALQLLAHFQPSQLSRIPPALPVERELIA
jgi:CRP-like cAMP-binding protein